MIASGKGGGGGGTAQALCLSSGSWALPHPEKLTRGGEDALFVGRGCAGVADGVGGWADLGVDPGIYSREFMKATADAIATLSAVDPDGKPLAVLHHAHAHATRTSRGSTTACFAYLEEDGASLKVANLGDSAVFVIRQGKLAFKTPAQQHEFNFPFQLGSGASDTADMADVYDVAVRAGDIIVLGTDGLTDNVYDDVIVSMAWDAAVEGKTPDDIAQLLTLNAKLESLSTTSDSPFARQAREAGRNYPGGKPDDITVVVCFCLPRHETTQEHERAGGEDESSSPRSRL